MSRGKTQSMPAIMTKRRNKVVMAGKHGNSTRNGKQTPWFVVGGFGDGTKKGETPAASPWNAGKCYPSKRYKT